MPMINAAALDVELSGAPPAEHPPLSGFLVPVPSLLSGSQVSLQPAFVARPSRQLWRRPLGMVTQPQDIPCKTYAYPYLRESVARRFLFPPGASIRRDTWACRQTAPTCPGNTTGWDAQNRGQVVLCGASLAVVRRCATKEKQRSIPI